MSPNYVGAGTFMTLESRQRAGHAWRRWREPSFTRDFVVLIVVLIVVAIRIASFSGLEQRRDVAKQGACSAGRLSCVAFTSSCIDQARQFIVGRRGERFGRSHAPFDQLCTPLLGEMELADVGTTGLGDLRQRLFDRADLDATKRTCERTFRAATGDVSIHGACTNDRFAQIVIDFELLECGCRQIHQVASYARGSIACALLLAPRDLARCL
ncbi:MAG TPA: hypothetical protein VIV40_20755 [Kofleriaceae bacterium]